MAWPLSPLPPKWHAALRDVNARGVSARVAAALRLADPASTAEREQALAALPQLTSDRDARVRGAAVQALGAIGDERAAPALRRCLDDSHALVRELAVIALGGLEWEIAGDALIAATRSEHPELRFQAILCAAESSPEHALPHVLRVIDDTDPRVRASAIEAASRLDLGADDPSTRRLRAKLLAALRDPEPGVRGPALLSLLRRPARAPTGDGPPVPMPALSLTAEQRADATRVLLETLGDAEAALDALEVAVALPEPEVIERIAMLARRILGSRLLAAAAARALARFGDPRAVSALRELLGAFRTEGRGLAVQTIGEQKLLELAPDVAALARRPRAIDALTLATCLAQLAPRSLEAARALRELVERDDEFGRVARRELHNPSHTDPE